MVWDDDINPEGFAQNISYKSGDNLTAFINLGQFILDEDKTDNNDQFLFGEQVGIKTKLAKDSKLNWPLHITMLLIQGRVTSGRTRFRAGIAG